MTTERMLSGSIGIVAGAVMLAGMAIPAYADSCNSYSSANCWINQQEATDPGYQSARQGGYYGHSYTYPSNYYWNTPQYSYQQYDYQPYSYDNGYTNSYRINNCQRLVWYVDSFNQLRTRCQ